MNLIFKILFYNASNRKRIQKEYNMELFENIFENSKSSER